MRTTVTIDDHLLARAKQRAQEKGITLGQVVEESLQMLFTTPETPRGSVELPSFSAGGFLPGIDYTSNASLLDAIDDGDDLRRQAGSTP